MSLGMYMNKPIIGGTFLIVMLILLFFCCVSFGVGGYIFFSNNKDSTLTDAPVSTTSAPEGTTPVPAGTTPAPAGTTPAPVVATSAPAGTTSAPVAATSVPAATTPAPPPIDCVWTPFETSGDCDTGERNCGPGVQYYKRGIATPASNGGKNCVGSIWKQEPCDKGECTTPGPAKFAYSDIFGSGDLLNTDWKAGWPDGEKKTCEEISTWWIASPWNWDIGEETNKISQLCKKNGNTLTSL
jgi:hypothetical protein